MSEERGPDIVSELAKFSPVLVIPPLLWWMGGWSALVVFVGGALIAGLVAGYCSRHEADEEAP